MSDTLCAASVVSCCIILTTKLKTRQKKQKSCGEIYKSVENINTTFEDES
jgi:hypothetical protein